METKAGELYLGGVETVDDRQPLVYESADLTTHGVIVGMTGSGKTGLGIGLLEECLLQGIPCLVLDPKGDMGNLLLNFPEFQPDDFRPWIDEAAAARQDTSPDDLAASTAKMWKDGLASWDIGPVRMKALASAAGMTIYTPGSSAGVPLNIIGSLAAPSSGFDEDPETFRDEIEGFVSSLLALAGVDADPVSSPEHILLATIIEDAWSKGEDLDLAGLIGRVQKPPFRKLGVFELDTFYSPKDRTTLAMRLNGLVASPSFASWLTGRPLDIESLLFQDGKPQAAIMYLAHLSDAERLFVVTLLLSKMVTWMRGKSGSADLRAMIYMDEVFGFAPPTAEPPSKKPILTILKQARAHGVGMVLSTQNPVDLDYKAMSNAGTWMIGRLQTERDKARILEGLQSASGAVDAGDFDDLISSLGKRKFLLHSTKLPEPVVFGTRWVMSYLAGPLTRGQVKTLTADEPRPEPIIERVALTDDASTVSPAPADGIRVYHLAGDAPWAAEVGATAGSRRLVAGAAATVELTYDDRYAELEHHETYEAILFPLRTPLDPGSIHAVDHDPRDFEDDPPADASYVLPDVPIDSKAFWSGLERELSDHLVRNRRMAIWKNPGLKLYSRVGEKEEAFLGRCAAAAEDAADDEIAALKKRFETRIRTVKNQLAAADRRVRELEVDVDTRRQQEMISGAGDLLGALLGGRKRSGGLSRAASRRAQTRRTEERRASAEGKIQDKAGELEDIEDQLGAELMEITTRWNDVALATEPLEIPLEKTDVRVTSLQLLWLPAD
ncbi:MAG: DUF87 domain-containing protein [Acidimicrobiia bacterium]|nr:DUF87 domain-containing protein [Acidimicrobiia bacterium]